MVRCGDCILVMMKHNMIDDSYHQKKNTSNEKNLHNCLYIFVVIPQLNKFVSNTS